MLHRDKDSFLKTLESTSAQTGFSLLLLEKDYYLTLILSSIDQLGEQLIFKGGTCLNKIYYSYYRLSEDLDFIMKLPSENPSRAIKRKTIKPIKDHITSYLNTFDLKIESVDDAGHDASSQYIFYADYESIVLDSKQSVKIEIGLRNNPILPISRQKVSHKFLHPFTQETLFDAGYVNCLALKELVAEKMRAAATRLTIAPRDFYDLDFLIRSGFNFQDEELWKLFKIKLSEVGYETNLSKYRVNLGHTEEKVAEMHSRISVELLDVLLPEEKSIFDLDKTLKLLNGIIKYMV